MRAVAIVLAVVAIALLAWVAGESHYQSCVTHAEATTADIRAGTNFFDTTPSERERFADVAGCSRLPF